VNDAACGLERAAALLDDAVGDAEVHGDHDAARRRRMLALRVHLEAGYAAFVARGYPLVRRRKFPRGTALGTLLRDPEVRAARAALGVRSDHGVHHLGGEHAA
jgi:hypothetical protein